MKVQFPLFQLLHSVRTSIFYLFSAALLTLFVQGTARADLVWSWEFTNSGLEWGNTDVIAMEAIITNSANSTENLVAPTGFHMGIHSGNFADFYTRVNGSNGDFPAELQGMNLAPGESFQFTFSTFTPTAGGVVAPGVYTAPTSTLLLAFDMLPLDAFPVIHAANGPFVAIIPGGGPAEIPEPATLLLLSSGLIAGAVRKFRD